EFMATIESATVATPEAVIEDEGELQKASPGPQVLQQPCREQEAGARPAPETEEEAAPTAVNGDIWAGLLQTGVARLQQLVTSAKPGATKPGSSLPSLITRDERTGERYVRLPVPSPEVLDQALQAVGALLQSLWQR